MKAELATMSGVLRRIGVPIARNETINLVLGCIRASHVYHRFGVPEVLATAGSTIVLPVVVLRKGAAVSTIELDTEKDDLTKAVIRSIFKQGWD